MNASAQSNRTETPQGAISESDLPLGPSVVRTGLITRVRPALGSVM